ncbi:hypothetical protein D9M72_496900 [compost metagenome]
MFANFYKKQFQDFEIKPLKAFELTPKKTAIPNQFIGLAKIASVSKITTISICLVCAIGVAFYAYDFNLKNIPQKKEHQLNVKATDSMPKNPLVVSPENVVINEKTAIESKKIKTIFKQEKTTLSKNNSQKTSEESTQVSPKDSAKNESQKVVIIKKQIIKKDTIYVSE